VFGCRCSTAGRSAAHDADVARRRRSRSASRFCRGDRGAVGLSRMPMARTRRVNASP
jgi:hypothetical protein